MASSYLSATLWSLSVEADRWIPKTWNTSMQIGVTSQQTHQGWKPGSATFVMAGAIYTLIDANPDYFRAPVRQDSRSWMNIVFRLSSEALEQKFISEANAAGLIGLKGHRSVGGIRVSLYNAMTLEGAEKVADFMEEFRKNNG